MNYKIILNNDLDLEKYNYNRPIKIIPVETTSNEESGIYFFNGLKIEYYIDFLSNITQKIGIGYNTSSVDFGPYTATGWDDDDISIPENQVLLETFVGSSFLDIFDFYSLCLQFTQKALEAVNVFKLKEKGIVDDQWIQQIQSFISTLEKLLESR